ncbi:MAG: tetratricopeptide repeat protein [Acidobacteria bacterium]|nr:tetratricopeptide repeat protein [Acidobacteriota bacterium]
MKARPCIRRQRRESWFFSIRHLAATAALCSVLACAPATFGQIGRPGQQTQNPDAPISGAITIRVQLPDRSTYDNAVVNLSAFNAGTIATQMTVGRGEATFQGLAASRYNVEVIAPGFETVNEAVEIRSNGDHEVVTIMLKPLPGTDLSLARSGPPVLAPGAQKELNKAIEALRANKSDEAKKYLDKAYHSAPANPDVNYFLGMYYVQLKDLAHAGEYWKKAIQIYPLHAYSLSALGSLALQNKQYEEAITYYKRAAEASSNSWRYEAQLSQAYLVHQECTEAAKHAKRAVELGKDRATVAEMILAKSYSCLNDRPAAKQALSKFIAESVDPADLKEAHQMLEALERPAGSDAARAAVNASIGAGMGGPSEHGDAMPPSPAEVAVANTTPLARADLLPPSKWMPPDVDESMPPVETGTACEMQQISDGTAKRVEAFIDGVNRISATETLDHEVIDRFGLTTKRESRRYGYVESLMEIKPGMYRVEEYRDGTMGLDVFPERLASLGLGSMVLIFHPVYRDEYEMTCEGLTQWHDRKVWQVHFRQRKDKPARMREYNVGKNVYSVGLRGRAWIAADTFQVVSIETDLVSPVPQIRLAAEHISIDYEPVQFKKKKEELWLPQNAELFFDFNGRRIHRRHHFDDYRLFSVEDNQKISAPKEAKLDSTQPSSE